MQVYKGSLHGMTDVAVKVASKQHPKHVARFVREVLILKACHDPHIVRFLGASLEGQRTMLAMEYMPNGDLFTRIAEDTAGDLLWYSRQVCRSCVSTGYIAYGHLMLPWHCQCIHMT